MTSFARLRVPANSQTKVGGNKKRSPMQMKVHHQKKQLRGGYCSLFDAENLIVDDGMDIQTHQTTSSPFTPPSANQSKVLNNPSIKRNLNFSGNSPSTPTMDMDDEQPLILRKRKQPSSNDTVNNPNNSNNNNINSVPTPLDTPIIFDEDVFKFLDDISTQDSEGFSALLKACDSLAASPVKNTPCTSPSASQKPPSSSNSNNNNKIDDIQDFSQATPSPQVNNKKSLDDSIIKTPMSSPPVTPVRYNKYVGMSKETIEAVMDFDKLIRSTENLLQTVQPTSSSSSVVEPSWLSPSSKSPKKRPTISEIEKRIDRAISESIQVTHIKPGISNLEKIFTVYGHKYYTVVISTNPSCSCPDNLSGRSGFHCKHILFVLVNILKVQRNDPCLFRRELLNSELYAMFYPDAPKPAANTIIPDTAKVIENDDGTMVLEPELEAILDSQQKSMDKEPPTKKPKIVDERRGNVPNLLKDFKPGVYTPPKSKQRELADAHPLVARNKLSMQEYLCRDCKKPFCRKGDRDNHELRMGHNRWRKGENRQLVTMQS